MFADQLVGDLRQFFSTGFGRKQFRLSAQRENFWNDLHFVDRFDRQNQTAILEPLDRLIRVPRVL